MRDSEFIVLAGQAFADVEEALDAGGTDVDCSSAGDGVLEIEFGDGVKIVLNRHVATQEIWLASRSGGFHFRWDGKGWKDTRDGRELMVVLRGMVSIPQ